MISGTTVTDFSNVIFKSNYAHEEGGASYFTDHSGGQIRNTTF